MEREGGYTPPEVAAMPKAVRGRCDRLEQMYAAIFSNWYLICLALGLKL